MSVSTSLIQAPELPDDEPFIHPSLQRYIAALTDSQINYMRFFSALLIPKDSHPQFFRDLKQFREQPVIIHLLSPGTSESYRAVSRNFIGSRFAHPWCRVQSDFGKGWHRAHWANGASSKEREQVKKEEERLHRLLVPIWIAMRRRMFPGDETVKEWNEEEDEREVERARVREEEKAAKLAAAPSDSAPNPMEATGSYPELGFAMGSSKASSSSGPSSPEPGAAAAGKMFLGVAVAGFIMSDKRVKKYVQKKMRKK